MTVNVNSNGPATSLSMILVMEQLLLSSVVLASGEGWKFFEVGQIKRNDANTKIVVRHELHI